MRTRDIIRKAKRDGREAGKASASWCFDGNTTDATYRAFLKGWQDGDPAVLDQFNPPNLSGEWADSPTPQSLASDYDLDETNDPDGYRLDEACKAWENAAQDPWTDDNATRWRSECAALVGWTDPDVTTRTRFWAAFNERLDQLDAEQH